MFFSGLLWENYKPNYLQFLQTQHSSDHFSLIRIHISVIFYTDVTAHWKKSHLTAAPCHIQSCSMYQCPHPPIPPDIKHCLSEMKMLLICFEAVWMYFQIVAGTFVLAKICVSAASLLQCLVDRLVATWPHDANILIQRKYNPQETHSSCGHFMAVQRFLNSAIDSHHSVIFSN